MEFAYIAIHDCGHIVAATVDTSENKAKSRDVAGWLRRNERVERIPIEAVRAAHWCKCFWPKPKVKE